MFIEKIAELEFGYRGKLNTIIGGKQ